MNLSKFKFCLKNASSRIDKNRMIKVIKAALKNSGEEKSMINAMEELAELQQQISKQIRYNKEKPNYSLLEEMADVIVCLELIKEQYDISSVDLRKAVNVKIDRMYDRHIEKKENC